MFRVLASAVPVKRWCTALNAGAGSAMLMQRMSSGTLVLSPFRKLQISDCDVNRNHRFVATFEVGWLLDTRVA
jgi:hypothetical protein